MMVIAISACITVLVVTWLGEGKGNQGDVEATEVKKEAEMPLITRLNYPNEPAMEEGELFDDGEMLVARRPEVRAVLRQRPAASEEMGGMPSLLREKLENAELLPLSSLLPLYQQWGSRNGPAAVTDALDRAGYLESEQPLIAAIHGWLIFDKAGPERWLTTLETSEARKLRIRGALEEARGL